MKKFLCLAIAILMMFTLAACGGKKITEETVNEDLQGIWSLETNTEAKMMFAEGTISIMIGSGSTANGTYTVDVENMEIKAELELVNGTSTMAIPFEYEGNELKIFNNQGDQFIKD